MRERHPDEHQAAGGVDFEFAFRVVHKFLMMAGAPAVSHYREIPKGLASDN